LDRPPPVIYNPPVYEVDGVPLFTKVRDDVLDGVKDESINVRDMEFWFSEGSVEAPQYLEPAERVGNKKFDVQHFGAGRVRSMRVYACERALSS